MRAFDFYLIVYNDDKLLCWPGVARPGGTCCDLLKTNIQAATFVYFSSGNQSRGIGDNYYLDLSRGFNLPIQVCTNLDCVQLSLLPVSRSLHPQKIVA